VGLKAHDRRRNKDPYSNVTKIQDYISNLNDAIIDHPVPALLLIAHREEGGARAPAKHQCF
jgi:hypothetical protein